VLHESFPKKGRKDTVKERRQRASDTSFPPVFCILGVVGDVATEGVVEKIGGTCHKFHDWEDIL
jgi:hypothetical protein